MAQVPGHQRVGEEVRVVHSRGECCLDAELFLDKYPWWDVRGLHHPFILLGMFVHAAESGWKEAERLIHHGHQHGLPGLDPKVDVSDVQLVGYQTS